MKAYGTSKQQSDHAEVSYWGVSSGKDTDEYVPLREEEI
jgi:hypothetical protein